MGTIVSKECLLGDGSSETQTSKPICMKLRWDKADLQSYYLYTGASLSPVLENVDRVTELFCKGQIDDAAGALDEIYCLSLIHI